MTDDGDMREIDLVHIELLLNRLQSAPLDVTLHWHHDSRHVVVNLRTALAQIAKHVARLRRVELWLPRGITREPTMDMFKAPTPILTHLFILIASTAQLSETFVENYFPHVPRLCFLELWGIGMSRSPRNPSFSCLRTLKLS
ncbi:hypothetical protein EXIGLDRAFT_780456 [Exidia glandulosa HHB12029]|uniref:Uncharacterized protein n=1 Tax=Exidia glandulosa HHB12029 TaxID=1314781 RepID=A0A165BL50_EXIGL|nr:hypothetical protein EXIGLDRAFT_780456 [Exidia glandulosa HHB12029]